jgi:hypothetical protein
MKITVGEQAGNWEKATILAVQTAGFETMSQEIIDMFAYFSDTNRLSDEAEKVINSTIRRRYGGKANWNAERWFIPIPKLYYDSNGIPQISFEIATFLVATVWLRTQQNNEVVTLAGAIGKSIVLEMPILFLHALLETDLDRFAITARDSNCTTWEVPGSKPVCLPDDFIDKLSEMLKHRSVVGWLGEFGTQGRCIAPLVAGNLLGLAFQDSNKSVSFNQQGFTTDNLLKALESMAYQTSEARDMVKTASPRLRADMTLEEAIRITFQMRKGAFQP